MTSVPRIPAGWANPITLGLLGIVLLVFAFQGLIDTETGGLREIQDYVITHSFSRRVVDWHDYFRDFTYALPAVVFKVLFAKPGLGVTSVLWMGVLLASAFAAARAFVELLGERGRDGAYVQVALAFLAVVYCVQWDLRAVNTNTVLLALVLWSRVYEARGRAHASGFLLATSIALKLYSAVLLPYLLFTRRDRELGWTLVWLCFYFIVVPVLYFGPADALQLTGTWIATIAATSSQDFVTELIAYKVSLHHVLLSLLAGPVEGGARTGGLLSPQSIFILMRSLQLGAGALIAAQLVWVHRRRPAVGESTDGPSDTGVLGLIDLGLLFIFMLLLSPLLEPHHGVLLLIPAVASIHVALDRRQVPILRVVGGAVPALCAIAIKLAPSGTGKGVALNCTLLAYALATAFIARALVRRGDAARVVIDAD